MNDPIYDSAAIGTDFILDVDLIERVEVIRGPGSSLYGNNAFFAVINVITRKGGDINGVEAAGSAGTLDTYTGRFSYGNRFTNGVELLLSGTLYDSAGNSKLHYPEFAAINHGVADNADGGWSRSAFASLSWNDLSLEGGFVDRKKTWPTAPYSTADQTVIFNDPRFRSIDERAYADLKFEHTFEHDWEVTARAYYGPLPVRRAVSRELLQPAPAGFLFEPGLPPNPESVGGELQVSKDIFEKHRASPRASRCAGIFNWTQKNFDLYPPMTCLNSQETATIFSFYAQDEIQLWRNVILNVGGRYDHFSTFGGTLNPRAALIYQPWEPTTFKFLYGRAFRAPNAYENYYATLSNELNKKLGPETVRSYELVWEQELNRHWHTDVSLFRDDIQNLISYQQDPATTLFYFANVDSVVSEGAEFEVNAQWADGFAQAGQLYMRPHGEHAQTRMRLSNYARAPGQRN